MNSSDQAYSNNTSDNQQPSQYGSSTGSSYVPIYQTKVRAGKRTYFFDIKSGNRGRYLVLTEGKKNQDGYYEKHKLMFFPEDVEKLQDAFNECFNELLIDRDESTLQYAPGGEGYQKRADDEKKQDDDVVITNSSSYAKSDSNSDDENEDLKQEFTTNK